MLEDGLGPVPQDTVEPDLHYGGSSTLKRESKLVPLNLLNVTTFVASCYSL